MKGGLCISWACKRKMAPILEPQNSVCSRFCQEPKINRVGPPGVRSVGLVSLPCWGGAGQAWAKEEVVASPQSHTRTRSVLESAQTQQCRTTRSWESGVTWSPKGRARGSPKWAVLVRFTRKCGEWPPPQSNITQSLTPPESPQVCTSWSKQLISSAEHELHRVGLLHSPRLML